MTDPKEAREMVRKRVHACPNCGGGVLVEVQGGPEVTALFQKLVDAGAMVGLVSAEKAEQQIEHDITREMRPTVAEVKP